MPRLPSPNPLVARPLSPACLLAFLAPACASTTVSLEPQSPPDFVYVVSVAAFQDSDDDGVGDLQGLRWHLHHIRSLGVSNVQLTPVQPGWDSARTVPTGPGLDPLLGSTGDLAALADDLHRLGMTLEVQVPMEAIGRSHPWFRQALHGAGRLELGPEERPGWCPTGDMRYYFASGGCGQADLDWDDAGLAGDVALGLAEILDAGVDRVVLRPFATEGARDALEAALATLGELRAHRPALLAAATTDEPVVETLVRWTALGPVDDLPRALAWDAAARDRDLGWVDEVLADWGGNVAHTRPFLGSYDESRLASRFGDRDLRRTLTVLHLLGPGHPSIYFGEELDLADATTLPVDAPWRAPMPWSAEWNCGFSGGEPWFEADPACKVGWNAHDEARDPDSMLTLVRWLGQVRAAWGESTASMVPSGFEDVMLFRTGALLVVGNLSPGARSVALPETGAADVATGLTVGALIDVAPEGWRVLLVPGAVGAPETPEASGTPRAGESG